MAALPVEHLTFDAAIDSRSRTHAGLRLRVASFDSLIRCTAVFFAVSIGAAVTSGLVGQCLLEKTRLEAGSARVRMMAASTGTESARAQLRDAAQRRSVEKWALAHGFVATEALVPSSVKGEEFRGLVVLNR